jgi:hypothetical protein
MFSWRYSARLKSLSTAGIIVKNDKKIRIAAAILLAIEFSIKKRYNRI